MSTPEVKEYVSRLVLVQNIIDIQYKSETIEEEGLNNSMSPPRRPFADFYLDLEYQPIASQILTQPSPFKRAESNLLADEKVSQHRIQVVIWIIYIYTNT